MSKKQYGVVGHPIGHTLSPFIHTRLMSLAGIDGEYGVYHITPEEFGTSFEKLMNELDGINITIPYKQAVMRFLNETDKTAELYGSVNTISIKHTSKTDFTAKGYTTEILVSYEPSFTMMSEWYKQLFGESEGKDNKGIFPASVTFSTDLHSMGQYIQEGRRNLFETVVSFDKPKKELIIGEDPTNVDGLNFLAGKGMSYVNRKAFEGTILAHNDGGVPNIVLNVPEMNEAELGYMIYFFEKACAISGYLLGVNPFNQPGVESYKKNMFALLGKPGYEDAKAALEARLG